MAAMPTQRDAPFALTVAAPAKLNLGLEVLGRRADGYHDLATIFLTVSLFDELSVGSAPGTQLALDCSSSDLSPQENLVWRAAEAMQQLAPDRGALLMLEKRIPVAAGLGGASSDAAATLLALQNLWQAPLMLAQLAQLAPLLGSDVPFLLQGGCALGGGRGEVLEALPTPGSDPHPNPSPCAQGEGLADAEGAGDAGHPENRDTTVPPTSPLALRTGRGAGGEGYFLIVAPRILIPRKTAALFAALQPADFSDGSRVQQQADRLRTGLPLDPALLGNTFSRALYALRPDVEAVARAMREAGAEHVALSGAGPAHYAVFTDMPIAQLVKRRLEDRLGEAADIFLTVPVPARAAGELGAPLGRP